MSYRLVRFVVAVWPLAVGIFVGVASSKSLATIIRVVFLSKFSSLCSFVISSVPIEPKYALTATRNSSDDVRVLPVCHIPLSRLSHKYRLAHHADVSSLLP